MCEGYSGLTKDSSFSSIIADISHKPVNEFNTIQLLIQMSINWYQRFLEVDTIFVS